MNAWGEFFRALLGLGLEPKEFTFLQISLRGLVVFFVALVLVRLSDRRALAKKSPFDILLVVILASVLSRAINGSASFLPTLGGRRYWFACTACSLLPPPVHRRF